MNGLLHVKTKEMFNKLKVQTLGVILLNTETSG